MGLDKGMEEKKQVHSSLAELIIMSRKIVSLLVWLLFKTGGSPDGLTNGELGVLTPGGVPGTQK